MANRPDYGQNEKNKINAEYAAKREQKVASSAELKRAAAKAAIEKKTRMNTMGTPGVKKTSFNDMKNVGGRK